MATMRIVVKIEAIIIFIRRKQRTEAAGRRIAQLGGNQNAAARRQEHKAGTSA
jgi:hypothetical protein